MTHDPFAPIGGTARTTPPPPIQDVWQPILPVPDDAPAPPSEHYKKGAPSAVWEYRDVERKLLGYRWRIKTASGDKEFVPLTWCRNERTKTCAWRFLDFSAPRPLYKLDELAARPNAPVLITEGEKAADAAGRLFPDTVAMTSPNGAKSPARADWKPLKGRDVVIWPDADEPGKAYAQTAALEICKAGALSVSILEVPQDLPPGFDAADAEAVGWSAEQLAAFVARRTLFQTKTKSKGDDQEGSRRRPRQLDMVVGLVEQLEIELWTDQDAESWATIPVNGHRENWPLRSKEFRRFISGRFFITTGGAIGSQALEDSLRVLDAKASTEGKCHETFRRIGEQRGRVYIDLCDAAWRAIEVTADGWSVTENPPVKFMRGPAMRALPEPEAGLSIDALREFVNVASEEDFVLVAAWLVGVLRPRGPYAILVVSGEQGSGKSNLCRLLRELTDPNGAPLRSAPEKDRDLFVMAHNSWVLGLDNLSHVTEALSDGLCRIATGGGFSARTLQTDREETFFSLSRPILLNGISHLTSRADLADRSITIFLKTIGEGERKTEAEFWQSFNAAKPKILGALLDGVSSALRTLDRVTIPNPPRMADFAFWATAAEQGLGLEQNSFLSAHLANRRDTSENSFEADPLAVAVDRFITSRDGRRFDGTMSDLLEALGAHVSESIRKSRSWPDTATRLGARMRRIYPLLRARGYIVENRHSGNRTVSIVAPNVEGADD